MSERGVYRRMPLRRYERDYSKPQEETPENSADPEQDADEQASEPVTDITAPPGGPGLRLARQDNLPGGDRENKPHRRRRGRKY